MRASLRNDVAEATRQPKTCRLQAHRGRTTETKDNSSESGTTRLRERERERERDEGTGEYESNAFEVRAIAHTRST